MDKVLKGVLRYNAAGKSKFAADIQKLGESFKPTSVLISCMDSRVLPCQFANIDTGDMFMIRNAGNMVPHYRHYLEGNMVGTEGAGMELGVLNEVKNLVVCGHSDCKAVNTLYGLRENTNYLKYKNESILKTWLTLHGRKSIKLMYEALSNPSDVNQPLVFSFNIGNKDVIAQVDPTNDFCIEDKLSQLHCLQQASYFSTYPFLEKRMKSGKMKVYAMWFDIHKGDVYMFSPSLQKFAVIDEDSLEQMTEDINS